MRDNRQMMQANTIAFSPLRRWLAALALLVAAGQAAAQAVTGPLVLLQDRQAAWVEFPVSARCDFRVFTLDDPMRVVVDFAGLDWPEAPPPDPGPGAVAALRYGLFSPEWSRLVLDLARPMRVAEAAFAAEGQTIRFGLRLEATDEAAFRAHAGAPRDALWSLAPAGPGLSLPLPRSRRQPGEPLTIVIDPGHGGIDPGTMRGPLMEKTIVLKAARILADTLRATGRYRVILTRERDIFVPLSERVRIARAARADALISLHVNSEATGQAQGVSVYTLSEKASDATARRLAELENRADVLAGLDLEGEGTALARVLVDLAQRETNARSRRLAEAVVATLAGADRLIGSNPHRSAGFWISRAPDVPSLLIEMGFLTHPRDRARLASDAWLRELARDLTAALDAWAADDLARRGLTLR